MKYFILILFFCGVTINATSLIEVRAKAAQQLDGHIAYLQSLYEWYGCRSYRSVISENIDVSFFSHPLVMICINDIQQQQNLMPFFIAWNTHKRELLFEQEHFLEECALLSLLLYNNLIQELEGSRNDEQEKEVTIDELLELYNRLADMPLHSLLLLLKDVAYKVTMAVEQNPAIKVLFMWLQDSWLAPTALFGSYIVVWLLGKGVVDCVPV